MANYIIHTFTFLLIVQFLLWWWFFLECLQVFGVHTASRQKQVEGFAQCTHGNIQWPTGMPAQKQIQSHMNIQT